MGALSSKSKSANVTLLRKSSNSENVATNSNTLEDSKDTITSTPAREKVLPFDPRSPAESFDRTPITVSAGGRDIDTPSAPVAAAVKVLDIDPRSPSQQVSRTPIVVESATVSSSIRNRQQMHEDSTPVSSRTVTSHRTVTDADATSSSPVSPKTSLANICTSSQSDPIDDGNDPRSPTVTVPRTPLEDKQFEVSVGTRDLCDGITKRLLFNQSACDSTKGEESCELQDMEANDDASTSDDDAEEGPAKASDASSNNKQRKPLASVQNGGGRGKGTPRALLQAKQCRTLEEEFSKNQRNILSQLVQDDAENIAPVPSTTQFVEEI